MVFWLVHLRLLSCHSLNKLHKNWNEIISTIGAIQYERYITDDDVEPWLVFAAFGIGIAAGLVAFILPFLGNIISCVYVCLIGGVVANQYVVIEDQNS